MRRKTFVSKLYFIVCFAFSYLVLNFFLSEIREKIFNNYAKEYLGSDEIFFFLTIILLTFGSFFAASFLVYGKLIKTDRN